MFSIAGLGIWKKAMILQELLEKENRSSRRKRSCKHKKVSVQETREGLSDHYTAECNEELGGREGKECESVMELKDV